MSDLIETSKYEPGMVLATPILNRYGQVLLSAGTELKPAHLKLFITWGIKLITVKSTGADNDLAVTNEMKEQAEKIVSSRMDWQPKGSLEKDLFEMGVKKVLINMSKRKNK